MVEQKATDILANFWDGKLPVDVLAIAKALGASIIELENEGLSGKFAFEGSEPTISYNKTDSELRKRFTIAHEVGHFVLGHGQSFRDPAKNFSLYNYDPNEVAANKFAAELLMPAEAVRIMIDKFGVTNIASLAKQFAVSQQAMEFRLTNLGFI